MGSTSNYAWPYPDAGASNNVPSDTAGLANAVDATVKAVHDAIPAIDSTASDITASAPGDAKAAGSTGETADAGHKHGREAFGASGDIASSAQGDTAAAGSTGKTADAGHRHARESSVITDMSSSKGSDTAVPTGSAGQVFVTGSLAPGLWLVHFGLIFEGAATNVAASASVASGSATVSAPTETTATTPTATTPEAATIDVIVFVTATATIQVTAVANATGLNCKAGFQLPSGPSFSTGTGYFAVRLL